MPTTSQSNSCHVAHSANLSVACIQLLKISGLMSWASHELGNQLAALPGNVVLLPHNIYCTYRLVKN